MSTLDMPEKLDPKEVTESKKNKCVTCLDAVLHRLLVKSCLPINNTTSNKIILFFIISILTWLFVFLVTGPSGLPGGLYFSLIVLVVSAHVLGYVAEKIKMPALLGMLLVGIFFTKRLD